MTFHPSKRLGQNFLIDKNIGRKIVEAVTPASGEVILEIGAGKGALTSLLSEYPVKLIAVEIDKRLCPELERAFCDLQNVKVICADFLTLNLPEISKEYGIRLKIIGNIPYSITGPILFKLLDERKGIKEVVLMVQKEVGERLVASPGCKAWGILSVLYSCYARVERLFAVSRNVFRPRPEVDSVVLKIVFKTDDEKVDYYFFKQLVKQAFNKRRKMLRGFLRELMQQEIPDDVPLDLTRRAEELNVAEFITLARYLQSKAVSW